ncbi:hypothetical protein ACSBR1_021191 [Camellia fascicularis]
MMSDDGSLSSIPSTITGFVTQEPIPNPNPNSNPAKRKRNLPGTPDPEAEVIALSPKSLMATNRFLCEICNKGFQRDQNLQLHRRGHNLPWKLKRRTSQEIRKKVYLCPEKSCIHHDPSRALGDLTGIKKHYSRKHGEKKWKCEKCSKKYAVQSDWKAHSKICGTREYKCDCGTIFSRKDSFITHRAFCDALAEESARFTSLPITQNMNFRTDQSINGAITNLHQAAGNPHFQAVFRQDLVGLDSGHLNMDAQQKPRLPLWLDHGNSHLRHQPIGITGNSSNAYLPSNSVGLPENMFGLSAAQTQWLNPNLSSAVLPRVLKEEEESKGGLSETMTTFYYNNQNQNQNQAQASMSATALLQKAAQMGSTRSNNNNNNSSALFGTGFGLMTSQSLSSVPDFNSFSQSRHHPDENLSELMNSMPGSTPGTGNGDGLFLLGDHHVMNSSSSVMGSTGNLDLDPLMPNNGKQSKSKPSCNEVDRSMTRDFLGVGGGGGVHGGLGRPLLQQELAKFGPMGSAMDLTHHQYSGSH